jgi:dTDP-4-dehydrorhamnose reductase
MMRQLDAGQQLVFPANEIRTPIDVITLGRALLELARNDLTGILHLAGHTRLNRYEMALQIVDRLRRDRGLVAATDSNAMAGRAPRPNDASLDNARAKSVLRTPMQTLAAGLELVLANRN